jgi:4-deoxy-L-threo-5-hexosulose-uronate ketol-isomerase
MQRRFATHPDDLGSLDEASIRDRFVADKLFVPGEVSLVYTHHDRIVIGGVVALPGVPLPLSTPTGLDSMYFCERRELAVVAVGATGGVVVVDGKRFTLANKDVLYIGRGAREILFESPGPTPGEFYLASATAHTSYPTVLVTVAEANTSETGDASTANERTVYKHLHNDGVQTAQLVLGITALKSGSVWNTMPPHLHERRTEIYLYMDLPEEQRIQHFMGLPDKQRVITLRNHDAVISPAWSLHFAAGTTNYSFVWVMAGENQAFTDMDQVAVSDLGAAN